MNAYLVTTKARDRAMSRVWKGHSPLALGHPFQWIAEQTDDGVRIRKLGAVSDEVTKREYHEISQRSIRQSGSDGTEVKLDGLVFNIKALDTVAPVFTTTTERGSAPILTAFSCMDQWVLESSALGDAFTGKIHGAVAFTLERKGSQYQLVSKAEGLKHGRATFDANEKKTLSAEDLEATPLQLGSMTWHFRALSAPTVSETARASSILSRALKEEDRYFLQALLGGMAGLVLLGGIAALWPSPDPKTEELVPAQFAKVVMTQTPRPKSSEASASSAASASGAAAKVEKTAVVQAFRAKALQSAVSGLLKGGMTQLLAQSDIVAGTARSAEAKQLLNSRSNALQNTAPVGQSDPKALKIAAVGGEGTGGGKGYGKNAAGGVEGQGGSFVGMDLGGVSVEEGLSKDEVGEVIHKHMSEVRYCYESALIRSPDVEGKLMVAFTIGGNGLIKSAEVKSSTLSDAGLDDCILRRLKSWKFPQPRGHVDVAVGYPFIFKSLGR